MRLVEYPALIDLTGPHAFDAERYNSPHDEDETECRQ